MSASTVVVTAIVYWLTQKWLLPALGKYEGSVKVEAYRPLSRKERRAIMISIIVAGIYVALILWLTFSSHGILRGVNGGLMHSPFIAGILFLLSLGAGITGMAYGFSSGRYRSDNDVIEGLTQPMKLLGVYFVIAFLPLKCSPASSILIWISVLLLWELICFLLSSRLRCLHLFSLSCLQRLSI